MDWTRAGQQTIERTTGARDLAEPEAALVARAKVEPEAFAALYARYVGPVYRYCYARLGSREEAEDATSQVFLRALAALPRYRERGTFAAWLFAIAHNTVTDTHRTRGRVVADTTDDRIDRAPTPEERAIVDEERRMVRQLLAALPPDQRRALELRLAGLTGVEIAGVLGRSHRAVKMLQFRAIAKLRRLLNIEQLAAEPKENPDVQG